MWRLSGALGNKSGACPTETFMAGIAVVTPRHVFLYVDEPLSDAAFGVQRSFSWVMVPGPEPADCLPSKKQPPPFLILKSVHLVSQ